jgi:NADPH-dependent 7-cyano-7-deazaguanine reductase QueF
MYKFNSELEAVEENSVSLTGRQASFRGTGRSLASCHHDIRESIHIRCTIETVSIFTLYYKRGRGRLQTRFKAGLISVAIFSLLLFG